MPDTPEIVKPRTFDMQANPDAVRGQANETFMLRAREGQALGTGGETIGFAKYKFQPELAEGFMNNDPAKYSTMNSVAGSSGYLFADEDMSRPEYGNDRGLLTRSVASTAVDRYLGTNVVAEERFGVDSQGTSVGISIQADGAGMTGKYGQGAERKDAFLNVDYENPAIQRGLSDLEVNDYLTGQIDRHGGNIFIDTSGETPKVTGIDNDLAFPEMSRDSMQPNDKWVKDPPRFMHEETARKVLAVNPDAYAAMLKNMPVPNGISPLSDAAIDQAKNRLVTLQNAIRNENGSPEIVPEFNKRTYDVCKQEQETRLKQYLDEKEKFGYAEGRDFKIEDLKPEHSSTMLGCPRTSYLGTAILQGKSYDIGVREKPDQFTIRPGDSTQPANRNIGAAERNQMRTDTSLIENADLRRSANTLKEQIASSEKTIAETQKNIAGLKDEVKTLQNQVDVLQGARGLRSLMNSGERKKLEGELNQKKTELKAMEERLPQLQQQLEAREGRLDNIAIEAVQQRQAVGVQNQAPQAVPAPDRAAWQPVEKPQAERPKVREMLIGDTRKPAVLQQEQNLEAKEEVKKEKAELGGSKLPDAEKPKENQVAKLRAMFERQGADQNDQKQSVKVTPKFP